jgi:hypothetical protein
MYDIVLVPGLIWCSMLPQKLMCARGTNALEGYHNHLRRAIGAFQMSPVMLARILEELNLRWNTRVEERRGTSKIGHCEFSLLEDTLTLAEKFGHNPYPQVLRVTDYCDTQETVYIVKLYTYSSCLCHRGDTAQDRCRVHA